MKKVFVVLALIFSFAASADLSVSPGSIYFGQVEVNSFGPTQFVNVYNWGQQETYPNVINSCPYDFDVQNYGCYYLAPGASCSIYVRFSPRSEGSQSCTINIQDTRSYWSVWVSGTGVK